MRASKSGRRKIGFSQGSAVAVKEVVDVELLGGTGGGDGGGGAGGGEGEVEGGGGTGGV